MRLKPAEAASDRRLMREALRAARDAARRGDVPVGALVLDRQGRRLAAAGNRTLRDLDPSAHAEIVALRRAARRARNHRLTGATLYCTLEPCPMCLGALVQARVGLMVYAAPDPKGGGISLGVFPWRGANHRIEVRSGALAAESASLLRSFFRARRNVARPSTAGRSASSHPAPRRPASSHPHLRRPARG